MCSYNSTYSDRDGILCCTYCGSMHPDTFMKHIEDGTGILGATDKNYKVYIDITESEPDKIRIVGHAWNSKTNPKSPGKNWKIWDRGDKFIDGMNMKDGDWYEEAPRGPIRYCKFYFEHLNEAQKCRFVELYNEQKLRFHPGDGFYRWPFFMRPKS